MGLAGRTTQLEAARRLQPAQREGLRGTVSGQAFDELVAQACQSISDAPRMISDVPVRFSFHESTCPTQVGFKSRISERAPSPKSIHGSPQRVLFRKGVHSDRGSHDASFPLDNVALWGDVEERQAAGQVGGDPGASPVSRTF